MAIEVMCRPLALGSCRVMSLESSSLHAVAAGLHVAPASAMVAAFIQKQPCTIAGLALPYACKGGVCCTCRAKVLEGEVKMEKNYTLEEHEIRDGFVLTCQCHPVSDRVVVSYDER